MTQNPLEDIENQKAQKDLGVLAFRIYKGAREDGASRVEAFLIITAYFRGLIGGANDTPTEDE